jgi:hypothetical protein
VTKALGVQGDEGHHQASDPRKKTQAPTGPKVRAAHRTKA